MTFTYVLSTSYVPDFNRVLGILWRRENRTPGSRELPLQRLGGRLGKKWRH